MRGDYAGLCVQLGTVNKKTFYFLYLGVKVCSVKRAKTLVYELSRKMRQALSSQNKSYPYAFSGIKKESRSWPNGIGGTRRPCCGGWAQAPIGMREGIGMRRRIRSKNKMMNFRGKSQKKRFERIIGRNRNVLGGDS